MAIVKCFSLVVILVVILIVACTSQLRADEPIIIEPSPSIATRIRWVQFHLISGRITATSPMVVPTSTNQRGGRREMLSIEINGGIAGLQYDLVVPNERLQIVVTGGNQLSISHSRTGGTPLGDSRLEYRQAVEGPVEFSFESAGVERTWKASGFWQIYLAEPDLVRVRLAPLLELLRPSWHLAQLGSEIEDALITRPMDERQQHVARWTGLVEQLASPRFAAREHAQRELSQAGQAVLPFLQTLDKSRLDAEQAYRVRSLIDALAVDYEDRVDRVAASLASDAQVWLSLLSRDDLHKRRVATARLASLLGGEIDFDPQADPDVRKAQLQSLREQIAAPPGDAPPDDR
jgi:hypothetical protein